MPRYQMAYKHCQKFQLSEKDARTLQTDRQTGGRRHNDERESDSNVFTAGT